MVGACVKIDSPTARAERPPSGAPSTTKMISLMRRDSTPHKSPQSHPATSNQRSGERPGGAFAFRLRDRHQRRQNLHFVSYFRLQHDFLER